MDTPMTTSDILTIVGTVITILGFIITLIQINTTQAQIRNTNELVKKVKNQISVSSAISDLSYVSSHLEELLSITQSRSWERYTAKSSAICYKISSLVAHPEIGEHRESIVDVLDKLEAAETKVSVAIGKDNSPNKAEEIHATIIFSRRKVSELLTYFSNRVGEK